MSTNIIFGLIFFSQVLLLSWYLPRRIQARIQFVLTNYPASEYPRLYRGDQQKVERSFNRIVRFNQVMLFVGLGLLVWINIRGDIIDGGIGAAIAFVYGMLQSAPIIFMDLSLMRHCKELREKDERPKRSANLTPRSIFNHTTPQKLFGVFIIAVIAILFDMYTKGFDLSRGVDLFEAAIILVSVNVFFGFLVRWRVYGKKLNPYLDDKDNTREVDVVVSSAMFTSIAVSVFFMAMRAANVYDMEHFEGVLMSLYMQAIMGYTMLYSLSYFNITDVNFEPFRADS